MKYDKHSVSFWQAAAAFVNGKKQPQNDESMYEAMEYFGGEELVSQYKSGYQDKELYKKISQRERG